MITDLKKNALPIVGERGLPEYYPTPEYSDNLLFYIQRNLNLNTVAYEVNYLSDGSINRDYPLHVYWIKYSEHGQIQELNYIQNKLAYGYRSKIINHETFEFRMVSQKNLVFYLAKINGQFRVVTKINKKDSILNNIFVFADDVGLFPDVRYIEFYGSEIRSGFPSYQKLSI